MNLVMTVVWYPWTEGVRGPAGTQGKFRNMFLEMEDAEFVRLPAVGELIFFEDGGSVAVETVGWKIDGTPYLYLGQRFEKNGEPLSVWTERGFRERDPQPDDEAEADAETERLPAAGQQSPPASGQAPPGPQAPQPQPPLTQGPSPAPPMPST